MAVEQVVVSVEGDVVSAFLPSRHVFSYSIVLVGKGTSADAGVACGN